MPVIDHEVHESTKAGLDKRYGCWNKSRDFNAYYAPQRFAGSDGYKPSFRFEAVRIVNRMSKECRYDMSKTDYMCEGCKHRGSGEAYAELVRSES